MTHRRHLLSAAAILLGAFATSECARPARAEEPQALSYRETPQEEEQRLRQMEYWCIQQRRWDFQTDPGLKPPNEREREGRTDALADLDDAIAELESDDGAAREAAQQRIIEMGDVLTDEVAARIAEAKSLEVRTRLTEILEAWRRKEYKDWRGWHEYCDTHMFVPPKVEYVRPYAESAEVARAYITLRPPETRKASTHCGRNYPVRLFE